jgi:hypothetical protein
MFRLLFLLAFTGCTQVRQFDVFDDDFTDRWSYTCNDHEDDSQVVVILDHCDDEGQLFVRSEIQMHDHEKYWGALLNIRECLWESVIVLDKEEFDHSCRDIDFVEVERLKLWDEDTGQ